jgi:hypothetical protein
MAAARPTARMGDGASVVRGWVSLYTLGLPAALRDRRRGEVDADLAEEAIDLVRRGHDRSLGLERARRLVIGIPSDLVWRFVDAPAMARDRGLEGEWVPLNRWTTMMLTVIAIGSAAAFLVLALPIVSGRTSADAWPGIGPGGFFVATAGIFVASLAAVPWPVRGLGVAILAAVVGLVAVPWLWGCWLLAVVGIGVRVYQASEGIT